MNERSPRRWLPVAIPVMITLLPLVIGGIYVWVQSAPFRSQVRIGASLRGGRHNEIATELVSELSRHGQLAQVDLEQTAGSLENLRLLQFGEIEFGLYQSGSNDLLTQLEFESLDRPVVDNRLSFEEFRKGKWTARWGSDEARTRQIFSRQDDDRDGFLSVAEFSDTGNIRFVANVYAEVIHIVVRSGSGIETASDLAGKRVALGTNLSGDYATSRVLLSHLNLDPDVDVIRFAGDSFDSPTDSNPRESYYEKIIKGFRIGELDAAILTIGLHADEVDRLMSELAGQVRLIDVENPAGLTTKDMRMSICTIFSGTYTGQPREVYSVCVMAQLVTRNDVDEDVVALVAASVLDDSFQKRAQLKELYVANRSERLILVQRLPDFAIHRGALTVFRSDEFDLEQFQNWEAMYSLAASTLLGLFFGFRWVAQYRERVSTAKREALVQAQKDELDRYLSRTIEIERAQMDETDVDRLNGFLDDITKIKLEALDELTHEDLRGDRTFSIFLMQCANLISKIQLKIVVYSAGKSATDGR